MLKYILAGIIIVLVIFSIHQMMVLEETESELEKTKLHYGYAMDMAKMNIHSPDQAEKIREKVVETKKSSIMI